MTDYYLKTLKTPSIQHGWWAGLRCAGHRFVTAFLMTILLTGACSQASAQFADLLEKAKEKAKEQALMAKKSIDDKIDKTIGSDPPTASNKASSTLAPATSISPDATKKTNETATGAESAAPSTTDENNSAPKTNNKPQVDGAKSLYTFCSVHIVNVAKYYSSVFAIGQTSGPTAAENEAIAQEFHGYIAQTYSEDQKKMSVPNCGPGIDQETARARLNAIQSRPQHSRTKVVFTEWVWGGKVSASEPAQ